MSVHFLFAWTILVISAVAMPGRSSALVAEVGPPTCLVADQIVIGMKETPPDRPTITDGDFHSDVVLGKGATETEARVILRAIRQKELVPVGQRLLALGFAASWVKGCSEIDLARVCAIGIATEKLSDDRVDELAYEVTICNGFGNSGRTLIVTIRDGKVEVHSFLAWTA